MKDMTGAEGTAEETGAEKEVEAGETGAEATKNGDRKGKAAIVDDPSLRLFQINLKMFKGEVQLSGFVDSAQSVIKAGEVARSVAGVKSVKNSLIVK